MLCDFNLSTTMKKIGLTLLALMGVAFWALSQPFDNRDGRDDRNDRNDRNRQEFGQIPEQLQVERIAFYTNLIGLTPEESQKFWPLHEEFNRKKGELYDEQRKLKAQFSNGGNLSEKEAEALMNRYAATLKRDADLSLYYHQQFMKVLPPAKVMKIYIAEDMFKNSLLERIRNQRGSSGGQQYNPWAPWQGGNFYQRGR